MRSRRRRQRAVWGPLITAFALLLLTATVWVCAKNWPSASAVLRAHGRAVTAFLGKVWGILPTPASELLLILLPLLGIVLPIISAVHGGRRRLGIALCRLLCAICALVFCFVCWYGVQYTAPPLAEQLGLRAEGATADQLQALVHQLVDQMNTYAPEVPRDSDGICDFGSFSEQSALVMDAYQSLAEKYPVYDAGVAVPKRSRLLSLAMSYVGNAGYFFPWTGEAVVNYDNVESQIPFNIAHESSHSRGIGPEAECNFSAYLICMESSDPRLLYSASFNAYVYAANALYADAPDRWETEYALLCDESKQDIRVLNAHVHKYDGPVKNLGESVNDHYIKATGQPEGIQSYGLMVDLLIAYEEQKG